MQNLLVDADTDKYLNSYKSLNILGLNCGVASMRGYRPYMEDRCTVNLKINNNNKSFPLGYASIFDGHGGDFIVK